MSTPAPDKAAPAGASSTSSSNTAAIELPIAESEVPMPALAPAPAPGWAPGLAPEPTPAPIPTSTINTVSPASRARIAQLAQHLRADANRRTPATGPTSAHIAPVVAVSPFQAAAQRTAPPAVAPITPFAAVAGNFPPTPACVPAASTAGPAEAPSPRKPQRVARRSAAGPRTTSRQQSGAGPIARTGSSAPLAPAAASKQTAGDAGKGEAAADPNAPPEGVHAWLLDIMANAGNMKARQGPVTGRDRARAARKAVESKGGRSTSAFRGVTHHIRTNRWESHIWEEGKQVYLGGFNTEEQAALAYDIAVLRLRDREAVTNFDVACFGPWSEQLEALKQVPKDALVMDLRTHSRFIGLASCVAAPGGGKAKPNITPPSMYRGVRRTAAGTWEATANIATGMQGVLGTYDTEVEAAMAYDRALITHHRLDAATNFDLLLYVDMLSPEDADVLRLRKAAEEQEPGQPLGLERTTSTSTLAAWRDLATGRCTIAELRQALSSAGPPHATAATAATATPAVTPMTATVNSMAAAAGGQLLGATAAAAQACAQVAAGAAEGGTPLVTLHDLPSPLAMFSPAVLPPGPAQLRARARTGSGPLQTVSSGLPAKRGRARRRKRAGADTDTETEASSGSDEFEASSSDEGVSESDMSGSTGSGRARGKGGARKGKRGKSALGKRTGSVTWPVAGRALNKDATGGGGAGRGGAGAAAGGAANAGLGKRGPGRPKGSVARKLSDVSDITLLAAHQVQPHGVAGLVVTTDMAAQPAQEAAPLTSTHQHTFSFRRVQSVGPPAATPTLSHLSEPRVGGCGSAGVQDMQGVEEDILVDNFGAHAMVAEHGCYYQPDSSLLTSPEIPGPTALSFRGHQDTQQRASYQQYPRQAMGTAGMQHNTPGFSFQSALLLGTPLPPMPAGQGDRGHAVSALPTASQVLPARRSPGPARLVTSGAGACSPAASLPEILTLSVPAKKRPRVTRGALPPGPYPTPHQQPSSGEPGRQYGDQAARAPVTTVTTVVGDQSRAPTAAVAPPGRDSLALPLVTGGSTGQMAAPPATPASGGRPQAGGGMVVTTVLQQGTLGEMSAPERCSAPTRGASASALPILGLNLDGMLTEPASGNTNPGGAAGSVLAPHDSARLLSDILLPSPPRGQVLEVLLGSNLSQPTMSQSVACQFQAWGGQSTGGGGGGAADGTLLSALQLPGTWQGNEEDGVDFMVLLDQLDGQQLQHMNGHAPSAPLPLGQEVFTQQDISAVNNALSNVRYTTPSATATPGGCATAGTPADAPVPPAWLTGGTVFVQQAGPGRENAMCDVQLTGAAYAGDQSEWQHTGWAEEPSLWGIDLFQSVGIQGRPSFPRAYEVPAPMPAEQQFPNSTGNRALKFVELNSAQHCSQNVMQTAAVHQQLPRTPPPPPTPQQLQPTPPPPQPQQYQQIQQFQQYQVQSQQQVLQQQTFHHQQQQSLYQQQQMQQQAAELQQIQQPPPRTPEQQARLPLAGNGAITVVQPQGTQLDSELREMLEQSWNQAGWSTGQLLQPSQQLQPLPGSQQAPPASQQLPQQSAQQLQPAPRGQAMGQDTYLLMQGASGGGGSSSGSAHTAVQQHGQYQVQGLFSGSNNQNNGGAMDEQLGAQHQVFLQVSQLHELPTLHHLQGPTVTSYLPVRQQ